MALTIPDDGRVSLHAPTLLNTHAILLGDPSLTCTGISRWRWEVPVRNIFLPVLPTGLWPLAARAGEAPVVPPGLP